MNFDTDNTSAGAFNSKSAVNLNSRNNYADQAHGEMNPYLNSQQQSKPDQSKLKYRSQLDVNEDFKPKDQQDVGGDQPIWLQKGY